MIMLTLLLAAGPVEITIVMPAGATAKAKVQVPDSWRPRGNAYGEIDESGEMTSGIELSVTCDGDCSPARLPQAMKALLERSAQAAGRQGKDVRLEVETIERGELKDGTFLVFRVKKPAGVEGPYRERFNAVCAKLTKDAFMVARAWTPVSNEAVLGKAVVAACKSLTPQ